MGKERRENNKTRQGGPWPTPIGMGALVSPDDFVADRERTEHHKKEEFHFEMGGMPAVKEYRKKHGLD
jgi:hypothetical protein